MATIDNHFNELLNADTLPRSIYECLNTERYRTYPAMNEDWGDGMSIVSEVIGSYWKPRFLMDNNTKCAYEFMDSDEMLVTVSQKRHRLGFLAIPSAKSHSTCLSLEFPLSLVYQVV